jgi:asparagine synthase (glutamine-hydrolysing)
MTESAALATTPAGAAEEGACSLPANLSGTWWPPDADLPSRLETCAPGLGNSPHAGWLHDGDLGIGLHGEVHNLPRLRSELGMTPDAPLLPVLAAGWQRWALSLLPRLDGVFALALHSGEDFLLYRDPSGLRNLYFQTRPSGEVAFTTHLAALPGSARERYPVAHPSLHEYLRLLEVAAPHTLLSGVGAVEPGRVVRWTLSGVESHDAVDGASTATSTTDFDSAVDTLARLLDESVSARLDGAGRPAAFLSGGIDSALLCALAARQRPDLTAITVGFDGDPYDETPVAQRIARHLGIAHEVLRFSRRQYLDAFACLSHHADQPMADPAAMATLLAFERCRRRFDVVLDGTGADEAVGLMPPRHVRMAVGYASRVPSALRQRTARALRAVPKLAGYAPVFDFEHPADTMSRWHGFTRAEIERLTGEPASLHHAQFFRTYHRFGRHAHFERYSALLNAMTCERLNQAMAISGATVRFPFWSLDTGRFIRQLRTDFRYLPGQPKRILRALLARYVPAELWNLPKHGFNFPLRDFLAADDHALVRRHLDPARWAAYALLRAGAVQQCAHRFLGGDDRLTFRVWALVVLGAWLEAHGEQLTTSA